MKIKYLLTLIVIALTTSCEKDFLEPDSLSNFDLDYIYSNVDDARSGVNAIYSYFNQDAFRSRLSNNMTGNTDIEHQSGWASNGDRYQIWDLNALDSNRDLNIVWTYAYRSIRDANIAIKGIENSEVLNNGSEAEINTMNQLLGEAYTLRAYWYSMLAYHFGDVPYVTEAPVAGADFNLPKTDRNEILSGEIQALIDIEEKMKWADETSHGIEQVNREYTLGMIARLALQRGGYYLKPDLTMARNSDYLNYYQIARDYTQKLITLKDRILPADFRQVFLNQCKFISPVNEDVLFEVPFPIGGGDVGWNIGIRVEGSAQASHDYGSGGNYMAMPVTYYLSFDSNDKRREVTCGLYKITEEFETEFVNGPMNISQGKWSRHFLDPAPGKSSAKGTGINWPMMRYPDILLMFAEAENELNGPTAQAQEALKRVRQRAFDPADWAEGVDGYVAQVSTSKEAFFDAIVDERAWEFGGEMIRKYELIRWGIYSEKVQETVEGLKQLADEAFNGTTEYPDYMYWKLDESGEFQVLNPDFKVVAPPDDTWNRTSFLLDLHDDVTTYDEWITRDWENYINGPSAGVVRYVFPIPNVAIEASQGTLDNSGYGF
ncbi:RagB/SusD family nutrient uptake outer membrane protein [Galbibacter sp. EGI 63066]|uniref:RagB/SusD family nutrient uptake outer membrane protein n=1 Tax=Galbibacter sp. EGI 63066 TaxID=2993559 RepID=UPI0022487E80|nr:RagB/SusD family nutrient uptake outer membrane protein [Galbibacter sp. EGI 63066]MCX2679999.1 RagB/SusD family nutrient uptake outer membrane protein [Galbibacter sp. EGI 63066]